jgi:hypothetical protein
MIDIEGGDAAAAEEQRRGHFGGEGTLSGRAPGQAGGLGAGAKAKAGKSQAAGEAQKDLKAQGEAAGCGGEVRSGPPLPRVWMAEVMGNEPKLIESHGGRSPNF